MDILIVDTTYDEARRCPICETPGVAESVKPGSRGNTLHTFRCMNNRCRWYDTTYVITVNRDGTVPPPSTNRAKSFPKLPPRSDEAVERANQALLSQQLTGGETR